MFRVIQKRTGRIQGYYHHAPAQKAHQQEVVLFLIFFLGLVLGTLAMRKSSSLLLERLLSLFENYFSVKSTQSPAINFSNALFKQTLLLLSAFCIGLCTVGVPFLYFVLLAYGAGSGIVSAYLYKTYMLKGIGYCALILYPGMIVSVASLIFACAASVSMSRGLMQNLLQKDAANSPNFRSYCMRYLTAFAFAAGSAVLETALYALFSKYFQFS